MILIFYALEAFTYLFGQWKMKFLKKIIFTSIIITQTRTTHAVTHFLKQSSTLSDVVWNLIGTFRVFKGVSFFLQQKQWLVWRSQGLQERQIFQLGLAKQWAYTI